MRWKLRQRGVDYGGAELPEPRKDARGDDDGPGAGADYRAAEAITCVYSYEQPRCSLLPLTEEQIAEGAKNFGAVDVDHFRVRVMPVLGASPALMGHALAAVALCGLAGKPVVPKSREPLSKKLKEKMIGALKKREIRREVGPRGRPEDCAWIDLLPEDVEYVVNDVWRGRCAVARGVAPNRGRFAVTSPRGRSRRRQSAARREEDEGRKEASKEARKQGRKEPASGDSRRSRDLEKER